MELLAYVESRHHLFTYYEIRAKLIQLYGEPKTDKEHLFIQNQAQKIKKTMPLFSIDAKFHSRIHKNDSRGISRIFAQSND